MIWRILIYLFLFYLLYKIIFELIAPVYRSTRKMKKDFQKMHDKMNEFIKNQQNGHQANSQKPPSEKNKAGDYIDFEEVK